MKRRILKKIIKGAHDSRSLPGIYRQARSRGSKKLLRRTHAIRRLSRRIDRDTVKKMELCKQLLAEVDACQPENEEERLGLASMREQITVALTEHENRLRRKREMADARREMSKLLREVYEMARTGAWAG